MEMHRWKIETMIKKFFLCIWSGLKAIWYWIVGHPAQLTFYYEGHENTVKVRKFKEIKPDHIAFKNMDTGKYVIVKSDQPIKYVLREE